MTSVRHEKDISLCDILPISRHIFLNGELPTLPGEQAKELSSVKTKERAPIVAYLPSEDLISRRSLWVHLDILKKGIEDNTDHPRVVPHAVSATIYGIDNYISHSLQAISGLNHLLAPEGEIVTTNHYLAMKSLASYVGSWRRTAESAWQPPPTKTVRDEETLSTFIEVCGFDRSEQEDRAAAAVNANRERVRYWRDQLSLAVFHPAIHELILAQRDSPALPEAEATE